MDRAYFSDRVRSAALKTLPGVHKAAGYFWTACAAGEASGCASLGYLHDRGTGVPKDQAKAAALYRKSCDLGGRDGCRNLGVSYQKGEGVPKDNAKAREAFRKACEGGDVGACGELKEPLN